MIHCIESLLEIDKNATCYIAIVKGVPYILS